MPDAVVDRARDLVDLSEQKYELARDDLDQLSRRLRSTRALLDSAEERIPADHRKLFALRASYRLTLECARRSGLARAGAQRGKLARMMEDIVNAERSLDAASPETAELRRTCTALEEQVSSAVQRKRTAGAAYAGLLWVATQALDVTRSRGCAL